MWKLLLWLYLINGTLLINHEMDSAYWHEWKLFKLPGKMTGFLLLHFPLFFLILAGAVWVSHQSIAGLVVSGMLSIGGIFAFSIHTYFIKRGHPEFNALVSQGILIATLFVSSGQAIVTFVLFLQTFCNDSIFHKY
ncbi:hypothetical protein U27_05881 [Candidatus Vecturithrix granuli]|uniref:Uncharacterized protein n=1 Tax=Vecturithrix granuli TaxID=1499967 RepID=A0A081C2V1_VECG1|nr:hypothetical protein U27_05881 [Candidatus Vecturithrix granuli]